MRDAAKAKNEQLFRDVNEQIESLSQISNGRRIEITALALHYEHQRQNR